MRERATASLYYVLYLPRGFDMILEDKILLESCFHPLKMGSKYRGFSYQNRVHKVGHLLPLGRYPYRIVHHQKRSYSSSSPKRGVHLDAPPLFYNSCKR